MKKTINVAFIAAKKEIEILEKLNNNEIAALQKQLAEKNINAALIADQKAKLASISNVINPQPTQTVASAVAQ